jgi:putative tryptophan/tyrosine transport system substrate-binding protein
MLDLRRRQFISLLGGASAAWPLVARAQQPQQMRRIGVLMGWNETDGEAQSNLAAFVQALQQLGWTDGRNMRIDYRWSNGDVNRMQISSKELPGSAPDAILAHTTPVTAALQRETRTADRICSCLRPGGRGFRRQPAPPRR